MEQKLPRLVIAGTNSGCGKTTVTCAVLQALVNRGLSVAAAKCGPDYIDPMFHSRIIGAKSANLDPFFFDEPTLRYLLAQNAAGCAVTSPRWRLSMAQSSITVRYPSTGSPVSRVMVSARRGYSIGDTRFKITPVIWLGCRKL